MVGLATVFGAGGGTSSYEEVEHVDLMMLWGSNARAAHPIYFHHVLKGIHKGMRLIVVDPRRTESAEWGDLWLGLDVGTDIALSNTMAREIIVNDLHHRAFIELATTDFDDYVASVMDWTLERGAEVTGIPADVIREVAHAYAKADRAMICWTLGITEHHNAADNVLALINLGLLTGHVGTYGSGLNPLRGQNNVQGGGDMGAIPHHLTGFQEVENDVVRARFEQEWGSKINPKKGWHLSQMFEAMEEGELTALYVIGENPAASEADNQRTHKLLANLDILIVQDIFLTHTAEMADVVLPAANSAFESEGTVTNSERRVQRVRPALQPPGNARDDIWIIAQLAARLGHDWGDPSAHDVWEEVRRLSPMHAGMAWERLEELGGIQWPCPDDEHPGTTFLHGRLWSEDPAEQGRKAPFSVVLYEPPVDELDEDYPFRLTTGRRLDSYNTGVQTGEYTSPLRREETLDMSPEDAERLRLREGERVRVLSRRGEVVAPVRLALGLRPGLLFMTLHFPDQVDVNNLTIDAWDPKSGTAEFKATAVRVEKLEEPAVASGGGGGE
ncbi:MAG: formate dehydrogenase [Actinomycetia bacterium]|nr:formate dehydrogenase [Actinomycetes bacterium]